MVRPKLRTRLVVGAVSVAGGGAGRLQIPSLVFKHKGPLTSCSLPRLGHCLAREFVLFSCSKFVRTEPLFRKYETQTSGVSSLKGDTRRLHVT